jgi:hypothetical protein
VRWGVTLTLTGPACIGAGQGTGGGPERLAGDVVVHMYICTPGGKISAVGSVWSAGLLEPEFTSNVWLV